MTRALRPSLVLAFALGLGAPTHGAELTPGDRLTITVRPSGVEDPAAAARERQERLVRRFDEEAYRMRWICERCMGEGLNRPSADGPLRTEPLTR